MFIEFTFEPKLLFIFVFPIFKELESIIERLYITEYKKDNNLFKIFRAFLSNEFSFIFLLIIKCMNKSRKKPIIQEEHEKNEENGTNKLVDLEIKTIRKKKTCKSILFLFLLSALYFGCYVFNYYVFMDLNIRICRNSIGIIYEIIILYILSSLILKEKYFKHHYFSIAPICISLIILFILYFEDLERPYKALWYFLVYYSLFGLFNVLLKKFFLAYFYSIYFVLLIIGVFVCVPMLIYDIIVFFVNKGKSEIITGFIDNINGIKNIFLFIVDLIFLFMSILGIFWTVYYLTPFHLIICEFLSEMIKYYAQFIQFKITNENKYKFLYENNNIAIFSVIFSINLICSLIFNEIIILKFCKLEYYTKKYIKERAEFDVNSIMLKQDTINLELEFLNLDDN